MGRRRDVIEIGPGNSYALAESHLRITGKHTALGYHKCWWEGVVLFHRDGSRYEIERATPEKQLGALSSFLAHTVYNPVIELKYSYRKLGSYAFEDLRRAVRAAIECDTGVLTQFHDADTLVALLESAETFDDVHGVLTKGHGPGGAA